VTIYDIVKKKSYEFSYLASKHLFRLEEFQKAVDYIKYAAQEEAIDILGEAYRKGLIRFLSAWLQQVDCKQEGQTQRSVHMSTRFQGLVGTYGSISTLLESLQVEE
jgi:hypothetical protein